MSISLSVILTAYKRPHLLEEQLRAIEKQKIKPEKITLLLNNPAIFPQIKESIDSRKIHTIASSLNLKFHGRFALALLQESEFVCIFDDDAVPGERWFENCRETFGQKGDCILGASGIILKTNAYQPNRRIGSDGEKSEEIVEVDLVGYSWFLKTEHLKYLWYEKPPSLENGEDISLSYLAQKYGKLKTYVPPHPEKDLTLHGSIEPNYGKDWQAHSLLNYHEHFRVREELVKTYLKNGWKTVEKIS